MEINMLITSFNEGWIVGFIESEGVFTVNTVKFRRKTKKGEKIYLYRNPAFYLVSKDLSALEMVRSLLKMGRINRHGQIFHLDIRRKSESIRLAEFLSGKLKSAQKKEQYEAWRKMVMEWKLRARSGGRVSQGF